ncbi:RNA polymerase sporulation sigma factor SigK [Clostridium sp. D2Q-11]|uniref:RNA polymerase sigma factor n=1 Tax=Anaeromonas frigoriresistens TaxID=2683708 RepID=A0A942V2P2_9FIRM|nr:RNA polymerase sporulation sigma factor SigK [Anaeromonas frigoriresistens]MBS4540027.1 RNA polymerase sporulation sigma factor SigK [Anaeromonas frigoriresistens]
MLASLLFSIFNLIKPVSIFLGYISNNNSFPQPLNKDEERKYLILYEQGDEEAKNILIERNLRLVAHIVKKYHNTGREVDDLISIGTIGLIKAISTFDRTKGTRLATYAARCIDNEILMCIRSDKKTKSEVYLQDPIGVDKEGNEISLLDILGTNPDDVIDEVHLKIQVKKLYEKINLVLKGREKKIIELRYGLLQCGSKTQREIAKTLGISRSYVSRIEKRAVTKLNKAMEMGK